MSKADSKRTPRKAHPPNRKPAIATDPIFAAIEAHKRAWADFEKAVDVEMALETKLPDDIRRRPQAKIGAGFLHSPHEIDAYTKQYLQGAKKVFGPARARDAVKWCEAQRRRLRREFEADAKALKRAQDKAGWTAMQARYNAANDVLEAALKKLANTKPATAAGIAALAAYAAEIYRDELEGDRQDSGKRILTTIARAAERIAVHQ